VFELIDGRVTLIEVAEGIDPQADVIANMGFAPKVSEDLATMDGRVFAAAAMGLGDDFGVSG
jgi:propionate CoA-transferase